MLLDYANGNITAEMAVGHSLQHIGKLYEAQTAANLSRYDLLSKVDTLEIMVDTLHTEIARLNVLVEQALHQHKTKSPGKSQAGRS